MDVSARFDDLGAGASFTLSAPVEQFVAWTVGEVAGVLRAAEAAARAEGVDPATMGDAEWRRFWRR